MLEIVMNLDHVKLKALNTTTELLLLHTRDANVRKILFFHS